MLRSVLWELQLVHLVLLCVWNSVSLLRPRHPTDGFYERGLTLLEYLYTYTHILTYRSFSMVGLCATVCPSSFLFFSLSLTPFRCEGKVRSAHCGVVRTLDAALFRREITPRNYIL